MSTLEMKCVSEHSVIAEVTSEIDGVDEQHVHSHPVSRGEGLLVVDGGEVPAGVVSRVRDLRTDVALRDINGSAQWKVNKRHSTRRLRRGTTKRHVRDTCTQTQDIKMEMRAMRTL